MRENQLQGQPPTEADKAHAKSVRAEQLSLRDTRARFAEWLKGKGGRKTKQSPFLKDRIIGS